MAIIGSLIKGLIDIRGKIVSEPEAEGAQLEVLKKLLNKAKDTSLESTTVLKKFWKQKISLQPMPAAFHILIIIRSMSSGGPKCTKERRMLPGRENHHILH